MSLPPLLRDNLLAALSWTRQHDVAAHWRLCAALWPFWESRGAYADGRPWLEGALAYLTPPLKLYEASKAFTSDPKLNVFANAARDTLTAGSPGSVGESAAAALAEFIVLDMFANAATGNMSVDDAIAQAEKQAKRIYR